MVGVDSITQVLPSFTGVSSSECLGSAFFCNTLKQLYLKDDISHKELTLSLQ